MAHHRLEDELIPKLERLDWLAPLSAGKGITLSNDPVADLFLVENPNALLFGVLYDSQYATRKAFASPLKLRDRLGRFDIEQLAREDRTELREAFSRKPALHRFPNKFADLTQELASALLDRYGGDASRIWREAGNVRELGDRLMELPSFGIEKTNWTVGMLGQLGWLPYEGWQEYRAHAKKRAGQESTLK